MENYNSDLARSLSQSENRAKIKHVMQIEPNEPKTARECLEDFLSPDFRSNGSHEGLITAESYKSIPAYLIRFAEQGITNPRIMERFRKELHNFGAYQRDQLQVPDQSTEALLIRMDNIYAAYITAAAIHHYINDHSLARAYIIKARDFATTQDRKDAAEILLKREKGA